ncbi:hypothetical protein [Gracilibacillus pellucidus]|nr:hypothetical protein [Gracilibacillus sp. S3-1-1]
MLISIALVACSSDDTDENTETLMRYEEDRLLVEMTYTATYCDGTSE